MKSKNIFQHIELSDKELFETLTANQTTRIERIVSHGQASPADFYYDQDEGEFVIVLAGKAQLTLLAPYQTVELNVGDWLWIDAHRKHRVDWTSQDEATIWLAVFCSEQILMANK
jgi:cupin 2 domain-containing protein